MTPTTAQRTQHIQALERANEVRLARASFRRQVFALPPKDGCEMVADLLENELPEWAVGMRADYLLQCVRRVGPWFVRRLIYISGLMVSENRRVGDLTPRQRLALVSTLRTWLPDEEAA